MVTPSINWRYKMKKHLSSIVFGCLGLVAGFTLCYTFFVVPTPEARPTAFMPARQVVLYAPRGGHGPLDWRPDHSQLEWRPYLIQPMLPPKVIGRYEFNGR